MSKKVIEMGVMQSWDTTKASSIVGSKASGASAAYRDAGRQVTEMSPLSSRFSTRGVQLRHILLLLLLLVVIITYYYYCVLLLWIYYYY
jgi:hypothetical protein